MFDPTKPVQTRAGHPARIVVTDADHATYPIVALVRSDDGQYELAAMYTAEGLHVDGFKTPHDLVNVPETTIRYMNLFRGGDKDSPFAGRLFPDPVTGHNTYGTLKLTFTDDTLTDAEVV